MLSISRMKSLLSPTFSTSAPKLSKIPPLSPYFQKAVQSIRWNFRVSETLIFLHIKPTMCSLNSSVSPNHTGIRTLQTEASQSPSGEIHVIVGPMFAGKTTTLLRRVKSESSAGSLQAKVTKNFVHLDETLKGLCFRGRLTEAIRILCCTGDQVYPETYSLLLQECIFEKEYMKGRRIHAQMITVGFTPNEYLKIKLLILYAKAGDLETAHIMFDKLLKKSLISWNAMIAGYVQKGLAEVGLSLYYKMRESGLTPDQYTFASVFRACSTLATLEQGKQAHGVMIKGQLSENVVVNSALMDMYFKCSNPCDGHLVFVKSLDRNVITWTSLISGYGQNGRVVEVLELFHRMTNEGFRPNYVTFLVVLSACSHGGLVNEGWEYFLSMTKDYGIQPRGKHYAAMVDLLGRAGKLEEAYEFARNSPCVEHSVVWGALLGACRIHGNMEMVKLAAKKFFELEPGNVGKYVVLCNAYAASGLWDSVAEVRRAMKESGMKKESGYSIIEVQREVHFFFMGNNSHKQTEQIYELIKDMIFILKDAGYVPDLNG